MNNEKALPDIEKKFLKTRVKSFLMLSSVFFTVVVFLIGCSTTWTKSKDQIDNTQYIQSLQYDLDKILAVDLTPKQIDFSEVGESREHRSGEVIIVTKKLHDASANLTENTLLNPSAGVVFPGAVLKQDHTLAEGLPTPYTFQRGLLTIRVDLPGLEDKGVVTIKSPTSFNVEAAIQKITNYWFDNVKNKQGYEAPIRAFAESRKAYTKEQIGIESGFGAQWGKSQATAGLKVKSNDKETIVYRIFKQIYYTVLVEEPELAGDMFAKGVKLDAKNMPATAPPGFVRSVDYGRIIIVQMTTTEKVTQQEAEATLEYKSLGTKFDTRQKQRYENIAQNSSFKALVLGGGDESAKLLGGNIEEMNEAITKGVEFSKHNPAYPISYIVADLKTRIVSEMKTTTKYIKTVRKVLPDRKITLRHVGAFVAKFYVNWSEKNDKGDLVPKSYASGNKTAGYRHEIVFTGDAQNIRVEAQVKTGLVWDPWHHHYKNYPILDADKFLKLSGTTLHSSFAD